MTAKDALEGFDESFADLDGLFVFWERHDGQVFSQRNCRFLVSKLVMDVLVKTSIHVFVSEKIHTGSSTVRI